jgi:hypothetical protein
MKWKDRVIEILENELKDDRDWSDVYTELISNKPKIGIHLAVFIEPFLTKIFQGEKTVESRFSINKISPFGKICDGDIIVAKRSGGPIAGVFIAKKVRFYSDVSYTKLEEIKSTYGDKICASLDPDFWERRKKANYITMIHVGKTKATSSHIIDKNDRCSWIVLNNRSLTLFDK